MAYAECLLTIAALTTHRIHSAGEAEEAFYANLKSVDLVAQLLSKIRSGKVGAATSEHSKAALERELHSLQKEKAALRSF